MVAHPHSPYHYRQAPFLPCLCVPSPYLSKGGGYFYTYNVNTACPRLPTGPILKCEAISISKLGRKTERPT